MVLGLNKRTAGIFPARRNAELGLREIKNYGFPMENVLLIVRNAEEEQKISGVDVQNYTSNKADEGAATGAIAGSVLGSTSGLLIGLSSVAIPGIGAIVLAGVEATAIATTLAGGAIGAATGSLTGGLIGLGIPEERAKIYNERVSKGEYLIVLDSSEAEINHVQEILSHYGIEEWSIYNFPKKLSANINKSK